MNIDWKYAAKVAAAALGTGLVAGIVSDRIFAYLDGKWEEVEDFDEEDMYLPEIEDDLDIPEGVNEVTRGKPSFEIEKPSLEEMVDYTKFYGHGSKAKDGEKEDDGVGAIHVISEEEFVKGTGNLDGYASVTGTWFAEDGILAGWDDLLEVKDVDTTIGKTALSAFDHPDIDAVYVRNDVLNVLYEIVRGEGSYEGAAAELSYPPERDGD